MTQSDTPWNIFDILLYVLMYKESNFTLFNVIFPFMEEHASIV